ncbi:hypothetical protein AB0G74_18490 [Streptomyces sp. NPDC020875]|uniref:hypothetical protein n=1 Tax=Streptomyces sp. NPDC020875 TaxID=3154898 RepID=UPI0034046652
MTADGDAAPVAYIPAVGDVVLDSATHKVGRVMDRVSRLVQLRPVGGGQEWDAAVADLTPVKPMDRIRKAVAEANEASRREDLK